jgi:hypothetical protein
MFPEIQFMEKYSIEIEFMANVCPTSGWEATKQVILPVDSTKHICGCGKIC